jgi:hypothetical protein
MKRSGLAALLALAGLAAGVAEAAGYGDSGRLGPRGGFLAQMDLDWGGDDVATVYFEDDSSQDVRAGQGIGLSAGGYFRPVESSPFEIDASIGYKFVTTKADNANIHLSRTLLQLEGLYRWPNGFTLGAGVITHLSPTLHGGDFIGDIDFDDATGFNAEIGWRWITLHYARLTYKSQFFEDVDASHVGIRFTYRFGQRWTN